MKSETFFGRTVQENVRNTYVFLLEQLKNYQGGAQKCVERHCELAIKKTEAGIQSFKSLLG